MDIEMRIFKGKSDDFASALAIRQRVFVEEQKVPIEIEQDEFDSVATHVLLLADGVAVGTGRLFADPVQQNMAKLGRVALLPEYRGLHLGQVIIAQLMEEIKKTGMFRKVSIHAQVSAVGLYGRFGFVRVGEEFLEAGIRHVEMVRDLTK